MLDLVFPERQGGKAAKDVHDTNYLLSCSSDPCGSGLRLQVPPLDLSLADQGSKGCSMRRFAFLTGCVAFTMTPASVGASFLNGNDLYEHCRARRSSGLNYIRGVHDAQQAIAGLGKQAKLICSWRPGKLRPYY